MMDNLKERTHLHIQSLTDLLRSRRSRRFGMGMRIDSGPLSFASQYQPAPLSEEEEATLAFAACGLTGNGLGDLCYSHGEGGNIMVSQHGRTVASGDGIQSVAMMVINDSGCHLLQRSRDLGLKQLEEIIEHNKKGELIDAYQKSKIKIADKRLHPSTKPIENININRWSAQAEGSTCFLPINDLSLLYINGLLEIFNETTGVFVVDERANFQPAGLARFAKSRGGHLDDDPKLGKLVTIRHVETLVSEFIAVEQGMMLQNLGLMAEAMGIGGFPQFANHEFAWFESLGFRMGNMPASRYLGCNWLVKTALRLLGKDTRVPYPLGLEVTGKPVLKSFCPPYFENMDEAVQTVADLKFKKGEGFSPVRWNQHLKQPTEAANEVAPLSVKAIEATKAYASYVWNNYGRFPAHLAPFRTIMAYQACHLDVEFYDKHYKSGAITDAHRQDFEKNKRT